MNNNYTRRAIGIVLFLIYLIGNAYSIPNAVFNYIDLQFHLGVHNLYRYILNPIEMWLLQLCLGLALFMSGICFRKTKREYLIMPIILGWIITLSGMILGIGIKLHGLIQSHSELAYAENLADFSYYAPRNIAIVILTIMSCNYLFISRSDNMTNSVCRLEKYMPWILLVALCLIKVINVAINSVLTGLEFRVWSELLDLEIFQFFVWSVLGILNIIIDYGLIALWTNRKSKKNTLICFVLSLTFLVILFLGIYVKDIMRFWHDTSVIIMIYSAIPYFRDSAGFLLLTIVFTLKAVINSRCDNRI